MFCVRALKASALIDVGSRILLPLVFDKISLTSLAKGTALIIILLLIHDFHVNFYILTKGKDSQNHDELYEIILKLKLKDMYYNILS
jgi:hypothetical protein